MSLIYCKEITNSGYEAFCEECGQSVGVCSVEEIVALTRRGESLICFNCEGQSCDTVPLHLFENADSYWLFIDGSQFRINWPGLVREKSHIVRLRDVQVDYWIQKCIERFGDATPLASITNLHNTVVKREDNTA